MTSFVGIRFGYLLWNNCGNRALAVQTRRHGGRWHLKSLPPFRQLRSKGELFVALLRGAKLKFSDSLRQKLLLTLLDSVRQLLYCIWIRVCKFSLGTASVAYEISFPPLSNSSCRIWIRDCKFGMILQQLLSQTYQRSEVLLPHHKVPGIKKFLKWVRNTFDFCSHTFGP